MALKVDLMAPIKGILSNGNGAANDHAEIVNGRIPEREEWVQVTPEIALKWLELNKFPDQRVAGNDNVDEYAYHMRKGNFNCTEPISFVIYENEEFLANGQHRLLAILRSGCSCWFKIFYFRACSMKHARDIYNSFDRNKVRNEADRLIAMGAHSQWNLDKLQIRKVASAARAIICGFKSISYADADLRIELKDPEFIFGKADEWVEYATEYLELVNAKTPHARVMRTQIPMSIGMATLRYQPEKAREFWASVAQNSGLIAETPQHTLVEVLRGANPKKNSTTKDLAIRIAGCWNSYYRGQQLKFTRVLKKNQGFYLLGTPFDSAKKSGGTP